MSEFVIINGTLITESSLVPRVNIHVKDGKVKKILGFEASVGRDVVKLDVKGAYVSPGFVDLHVHGSGGYDSTDATVTALTGMREALVPYGVTTLAPTLLSSPPDRARAFLEAVRFEVSAKGEGARIVGAHLEGPFLNPSKRGVHLEEDLKPASVEAFNQLADGYRDLIKIMTLAPELDGALAVIGECKKVGIVSSIGHSNASYSEARKGIQAGISHSTHTFNAMSTLQARAPGTVGAVLSSDNVYAEVIADGIHVHPSNVNLLTQIKGATRTILVTDAVKPAGTGIKEFAIGGIRATVRDGAVLTSEGRLCGSILTMDKAIRNLRTWTNRSMPEIVRMASLNPAEQLGIAERTGSLVEGKDADIVILDRELNVKATFVRGVKQYAAG
jgi:N-acetylglucosamine-6-phosphate deacetylase